jgi:predicted Fe-Mo cluster-binding NifX family protein
MKVMVASQGTTPDSLLETRFGRGKYFLTFDTESGLWEPMTMINEASEAIEGAGTQAAKAVISAGAKAVIASHCGPRAYEALEEAGVKIYPISGKTAAEAVEALNAGELQPFTGPDLCSLPGRPGESAGQETADEIEDRPASFTD